MIPATVIAAAAVAALNMLDPLCSAVCCGVAPAAVGPAVGSIEIGRCAVGSVEVDGCGVGKSVDTGSEEGLFVLGAGAGVGEGLCVRSVIGAGALPETRVGLCVLVDAGVDVLPASGCRHCPSPVAIFASHRMILPKMPESYTLHFTAGIGNS